MRAIKSVCHSCRRRTNSLNLDQFPLFAAFCRQLPSDQIDLAEACGSPTQTANSRYVSQHGVFVTKFIAHRARPLVVSLPSDNRCEPRAAYTQGLVSSGMLLGSGDGGIDLIKA